MRPLPQMTDRRRRLCVCADDFGLNTGINTAILTLLEQGVVTATSCMVLRSAWTSGARLLREVPPGAADLGLHLDLTDVDGSHAESNLPRLIHEAYSGRLDRASLTRRIENQLDRFEEALGRTPDHFDGHRHVHQLPIVRDVVIEVLLRRYGIGGPWLRGTKPGGQTPSTAPKQLLIHALGGRGLRQAASMQGLRMSRRLLGVYDFSPTPGHYLELLERWVMHSLDGDVLMCHPGMTASAHDPIGAARTQEFAALRNLRRCMAIEKSWIDLMPLSWHMQTSSLAG